MPSTEQPSGSPTKSAARSSPRSSADSGGAGQGHTPFLQSLQQRFRKSSNASPRSPDQAAPQPDIKSRTDASRDAKRYLLSVIRDDWDYPSTAVRRPLTPTSRQVVSYRRREDGLSDGESDHSPQKRRSRSDPYKFENPDSVASYVSQRRAKRRRLNEEEMSWNVGLRTWILQRDAWTGAVKHKPHKKEAARTTVPIYNSKPHLSSTLHERNASDSTTDSSLNWPLSPHSPTARDSPENSSSIDSIDFAPQITANQSSNTTSLPVPRPALRTNPSGLPPNLEPPDSDSDNEPYLPIFPPLFPPTHVLRSRITPSAYPTIYSKIVLQSLTPNIPIPLSHMTRALVEGWKAEGQWPPTASGQNPAGLVPDGNPLSRLALAKAKKRKEKGEKESAFSRWRREHSRGNYLKVYDREQRLMERSREREGGSQQRQSSASIDTHANANTNASLNMNSANTNVETGTDSFSLPDRTGKVRKSITKMKRALQMKHANTDGRDSLSNSHSHSHSDGAHQHGHGHGQGQGQGQVHGQGQGQTHSYGADGIDDDDDDDDPDIGIDFEEHIGDQQDEIPASTTRTRYTQPRPQQQPSIQLQTPSDAHDLSFQPVIHLEVPVPDFGGQRLASGTGIAGENTRESNELERTVSGQSAQLSRQISRQSAQLIRRLTQAEESHERDRRLNSGLLGG